MSVRGIARCFAAGLFSFGTFIFGLVLSGPVHAENIKIGILFDVTGPVSSFVQPMLDSVKLAVDEVNASGGILNGQKLEAVLADTKSTPDGAVDAANKLINSDNVTAIVGSIMSSTTMAAAHGATVPNGVVLITPSATATRITTMEGTALVFRTVPSDAYQGWALAKLVYAQGFTKVAVTYINNDYGSGVEDTFRDNFENLGGTVTTASAHEPNKTSYVPELQQLSQYDPQALLVVSFAAGGGITLVKQALDGGFFKQFIGSDALMDPLLIKEVGADKLKGMFFTSPTFDSSTSAAHKFEKLYDAAYGTSEGKPYIAQTYDAVMLAALAIEWAGSADRTKIPDALHQVCCAPGEVIEPGEWAKAKADISAGKKINYEGAAGSNNFDEIGDVTGVYGHYIIENGAFKLVEMLKQ